MPNGEKIAGITLADAILVVGGALDRAAATLGPLRQQALSIVDAAEAVGCAVADTGAVTAPTPQTARGALAVQAQLLLDNPAAAQSLCNTAAAQYAERLTHALDLLDQQDTAAGVEIGKALQALTQTSRFEKVTAVAAPNLSAEQGKRDFEALASGNLSPQERRAIEERLAQAQLTSSQNEDRRNAVGDRPALVLPAGQFDYLKSFYASAGKDGLLSLDDKLGQGPTIHGESPNQIIRSNIASGLFTLSSPNVGSSSGETGGMGQLPKSVQDLVGPGVSRTTMGAASGFPVSVTEITNVDQVRQFAGLLDTADPSVQQGSQLSASLVTKASELARYEPEFQQKLPTTLIEDSRGVPVGTGMLNDTIAELTQVGGRDHLADAALLTGKGMPAGYDPSATMYALTHNEWQTDAGTKAKNSLWSWIGGDIQTPGPVGDNARSAFAGLPGVFAPTQGHVGDGALVTMSGGTSYVQGFNEDFAEHPEYATSMSRLLGSHLDVLAGPGAPLGFEKPSSTEPSSGAVQLNVVDGNRLLMLASESGQGRITLESAQGIAQQQLLGQAVREGGADPSVWLRDNAGHLPDLSARIDVAGQNAITFQNTQQATEYNDHQISVHDAKVKALEIAGSVLTAPLEVSEAVPGAGMLGAGLDAGKEALTSSLIEQAVNDPDLHSVTVAQPDQMAVVKQNELMTQALRAYDQNGQVPAGLHDGDAQIDFSRDSMPGRSRDAREFLDDRGIYAWINEYQQDYASKLQSIPQTNDELASLLGGGYVPRSS
ncbi:hypothetical protein G4X40_05050 [Rhodococcus sp. D2-41]|uniref:TPR repeat domain-containing protein n=1 Tax=Speluncibacter jeojiensis TaxID=2710754 RepID=A0A9X4M439_9ACTN|nr:hypothetical protein [Rhodococcus sp. D2-41]MDG3009510.1 hypothetical protein [Rhodococcus sp. D2-41]MDG3016439.1 hypothetical protein [Corynebacteriales bacterium D3-21]